MVTGVLCSPASNRDTQSFTADLYFSSCPVPIPRSLAANFPTRVRERGLQYQRTGRVKLTNLTAARIEAVVRGSLLYDVSIRAGRDGTLELSCSCPYAEDDPCCKHVWATLIEADAKGVADFRGFDADGAVSPTLDLERAERSSSRRDRQSSPSRPRRSPWKTQLENIRSWYVGAPSRARVKPWPDNRRLVYVVDASPAAAAAEGILVTVATQQRKSDGTWAAPKGTRLSREQWNAAPDPEDRVLAQMLLGARQTYGYVGTTTPTQYVVAVEAADTTMRRICGTGRCLLRSEPGDPNPPLLQWDDGHPWELRLSLAPANNGARWHLEGTFARGNERVRLAECTLLLRGLFVANNELARYDDHGAFPIAIALRSRFTVEVSRDEAIELVGELVTLPALPPLDIPDEFRVEVVRPNPRPRLSLAPLARVAYEQPRVAAILGFDYDGHTVASGQREGAIFDREKRRLIQRDEAAEDAAADRLRVGGVREEYDYRTGRRELRVRASKADALMGMLAGEGWFVEFGGRKIRDAGSLQAEITSGIDWFDLNASVDFGDVSAPLPELLAALERGERAITLSDGSLGIVSDEWVARASALASLGQATGGAIRFAKAQAGLLDALVDALPNVRIDERFRTARTALRQFEGTAPRDAPDGFGGVLRPYQREGLGWLDYLKAFGFGGCLADDMGLGKTVQALALLESRRREKAGPSLVVVPRSLLFNWQQEARRFAPEMRVLVHSGTDRRLDAEHFTSFDLVLTTYGTLRRDAPKLRDFEFDYAILDEAQAIKNATTASAKAVRLLRARHRLAMTGTPIENRLGDLWSLMDFLNPGLLGSSRVFQRLVRRGDANGDGRPSATGAPDRELLARAVRPFLLRRTKAQVASDLPPKLEQTIYVEMSAKERKRYEELRDHYRKSLLARVRRDGMARSKMHVLEALLRLRQAACHPGLIDKSLVRETSSKLDVLLTNVGEAAAEGHKALVFSQFTSLLAIVRRQLEEQGVEYEYLDGKTRDREQRVSRFQSDASCRVFLISLRAGGLGLNLTAAEYVFLLDPWWNPAIEAQAIDRAHRIGQQRCVFASRLIAKDTVEEKVLLLQQSKRELADAIIRAEDGPLSALRREDLELLLSS